jgi:tRNA 2-selenouridine synthase
MPRPTTLPHCYTSTLRDINQPPLNVIRNKQSTLISIDDALANIDEFDAIIDVRSPAEFAEDHIPGAINCPVLDDEQRARVGTLYKQVSPFDAKKIGAALVARNIAANIELYFLDKPRDWRPLVYCWRGGNRSGAMTHILGRIGWHALQLEGGYKEYRRQVNDALAELPARFTFRVVCGTTGSGKSRLLQELMRQGAQVIDLEQLAAHRGSVLGNLPEELQPSQKMFESRIWRALRNFDPERVIFIESESKKVGNLRVPDALMTKMRESGCVSLSLPHERRVALLMEDYAHFVKDPDALNAQLDCLTRLHGHERIARWKAMATSGAMPALVEELLVHHYDPSYLRSIERNFSEFGKATPLALEDIGEADFAAAARLLMKQEK